MRFIGFEREQEAIAWAKSILQIENPTGFCRAIATVDEAENFVFVVVLSNFSVRNVDMHTAAVPGAQWARPKAAVRTFNAVFGYAFEHLGLARVTGLVKASNREARGFDEHIGFTLEGIMREAFVDDDLCVYGFLAEEFRAHQWYRSSK